MEENQPMSNLESISEKIELLDHSLSVASRMMNAWKLLLGGLVLSVLWIARIEYAINDLREKQIATDKDMRTFAEIVAQLKTESALHRQSIQDLRGRSSTSQNVDVKVGAMADSKDYEDTAKRRGYYLVAEVAKKIGKSERTITQLCSDGMIPGAFQPTGGRGWQIPLDFQFGCSETAALTEQPDYP